MDNINLVLAENIQKFRKEKNMTQKELAEKLGVTYQAVSKWENASSAPDISLLPMLADVFGCPIDTLFSLEIETNENTNKTIKYNAVCTSFPWNDDDVIRGVVCCGHKILEVTDGLVDRFTFEIVGDAKRVESKANISVNGSVNGGCNAKRSIEIAGDVNGGINCGSYVNIGGGHTGGINCGAYVSCGGNIEGGINCGASVSCHNVIAKGINWGSTISATENIEADTIKIKRGDVICNSFKCDTLKGNIKVKTNG